MTPNSTPATISYREAIQQTSAGESKIVRVTAGRHEYAHVRLELNPLPRGRGLRFTDEASAKLAIPRRFIEAIKNGVQEVVFRGVWGFPLSDVHVTILDGSYHDIDSNAGTFQDAASQAVFEAMLKARPVILEPVASVILSVPEHYVGDVLGDINQRRGRILDLQNRTGAGVCQITTHAPLVELLRYSEDLASLTAGKGSVALTPAGYEVLPAALTAVMYCRTCRREIIVPKIREKLFSDSCLICTTPFEPPGPELADPLGVT